MYPPNLNLNPEMRFMTNKEIIELAKTPRGAWTKVQLQDWGIPWPPPKGWKKKLEKSKTKLKEPIKLTQEELL